MTGGHLQKSRNNVILTTNAIKQALGLPLTVEEKQVEKAMERREHAEVVT